MNVTQLIYKLQQLPPGEKVIHWTDRGEEEITDLDWRETDNSVMLT